MASKPYIVLGATEGKNPYRREIQELMTDEYQFSLFMQAVENLKKKNYKPDPASWQQMCGIHGLPYTRWSGDPDGSPVPDDKMMKDPDTGEMVLQWQGYCYHSSMLFPTWHRILLLLFEQAMTDEAKVIAANIIKSNPKMSSDERNEWLIASRLLRWPFWDWSSRNAELYGLPVIIHQPEVIVRGPNGGKILLSPNPLAFYEFSEIPAGVDKLPPEYETKYGAYFKEWTRTYRWAYKAGGYGDPWAEDYEKLNNALKNGQNSAFGKLPSISMMCDKLKRMFSFPATDDPKRYATYWDYFADTAPQSCPRPEDRSTEPIYRSAFNSLESPHNTMHLDLGGSGDMAFNEMAGFDPVFYLHHCNVDRLYALWEYVYPDYWMGNKGYYKEPRKGHFEGAYDFTDVYGTYQGDPAAVIKADTGLAPFRHTEAHYWTSEELRSLIPSSTAPQTYSYPPVVLRSKSGQVTIDVTQPVDLETRKLYITALQDYYKDLSPKNAAGRARPGLFTSPIDLGEIPKTHTPVDGYRDFVVVGFLQQFAFRGSHRLQLYLDSVWVNEISVFSRMLPERCQHCAGRIASGNAFVRGAMGLPYAVVVQALEKEGKNAEDTTDEEVIEVLKRRLHAKIVAPNGTLLAEHAAQSHATGDEVSAQGLMAREDSPAFYLCSARLLESDDRTLPSEFFDWQDHGSVLDFSWRLA